MEIYIEMTSVLKRHLYNCSTQRDFALKIDEFPIASKNRRIGKKSNSERRRLVPCLFVKVGKQSGEKQNFRTVHVSLRKV